MQRTNKNTKIIYEFKKYPYRRINRLNKIIITIVKKKLMEFCNQKKIIK